MEAVNINGPYGTGGQSFVVLGVRDVLGSDILRRADSGRV